MKVQGLRHCNSRSARTKQILMEAMEQRTMMSVTLSGAPSWLSEGPGPIHGGQAFERDTFTADVAGAVNAVATDVLNTRAFIGTVNGGIWRTDNLTSDHPNWIPLTDQLPSLSVGDVAISPVDNFVIWAGLGQ